MPRARQFGTSANYFTRAAPLFVSAAPFSFAAWIYPFNLDADHYIMSMTVGGAAVGAVESFRLVASGSTGGADQIRFSASTVAGGAAAAATTIPFMANKWQRVMAVAISDSSRAAYLNGGGKGTNGTTRAPAGLDTMRIGTFASGNSVQGYVGFFDLWDVALTDDEVAMDARGIIVRPDHRLHYPMSGFERKTERDTFNRFPFTMVGDCLRVPGPPVVEATERRRYRQRASVTTLSVPSSGTKASAILWAYTQGTTVNPPPPIPQPPSEKILWTDDRIIYKESPDRTYVEHPSYLQVIGPNSVIGVGKRFNTIPETGLAVLSPDGQTRTMHQKVYADPANTGTRRNWFWVKISNKCPLYSTTENTIRMGVGGAYDNRIQVGTVVWQVMMFIIGSDIYNDDNSGGVGNTSIGGNHPDPAQPLQATHWTLRLWPAANKASCRLEYRIRRWNPPYQNNPSGNPDLYATTKLVKNIVGWREYILVSRWSFGWTPLDAAGTPGIVPSFEAYIMDNGVWDNGGAPVFTFDGARSDLAGKAIGINATKNGVFGPNQARGGFTLYDWLHAFDPVKAWPLNPNGATMGFPADDRGWQAYYRSGIVMTGEHIAGRADVNQYTLAATAQDLF